MTVGELREKLRDVDDCTEVLIQHYDFRTGRETLPGRTKDVKVSSDTVIIK